jgi:hypothetical protein
MTEEPRGCPTPGACSAVDRIAKLEGSLRLICDANQRGIKRWQQAHPGNDLVWPDQAKMVEWMLNRIAELEAKLARVTEALTLCENLRPNITYGQHQYVCGHMEAKHHRTEALRAALSDADDGRAAWIRIKDAHPPPHQGSYRVRRDGEDDEIIATVCYGMHTPWWCLTDNCTLDMQDDDLWRPAAMLAARKP